MKSKSLYALIIAFSLAGGSVAHAQAPAPIPATPDDVWAACFLDLHDRTEPADQPYVRYLYAPDDSAPHQQLIDYGANSTSFRSELGHVEPIGGRILKLDLRAFAWDFPSRQKRLAELERRGVKFGFKDAEERRLALDPFEQLAKADPFFVADSYDSHGTFCPGWLDTGRVNAARQLSRSLKLVLRADWILPRLLSEKSFGGIYSDLLLFPAKEAEFYRSFLIDIDAINRDNQLLHGGAVLSSIVAKNNRELQTFPSPYGNGGVAHAWRTLDVNTGAQFKKNVQGGLDPKSVTRALRGTIVHDGRESLGTLPNGLFWWQLYNNSSGKAGGTGERVDVVPEDIAQILAPLLPVKETRVINSFKCIECHTLGIRGFDDVIRKTFLSKQATLKSVSSDPHAAAELAGAIEDFYASDLGKTMRSQQVAYLARLKEACGMDGVETATNVVGAIENYLFDLVTPEAAAREMGYDLQFSTLAWQASQNPQLVLISSGQAIPRTVWEESFGDAMRSAVTLKKRLGQTSKDKPY